MRLLRQRTMLLGPRELSDCELAALVFGRGGVPQGKEVMEALGGWSRVFSLESRQLQDLLGCGRATAIRLQAGVEAGRRAVAERDLSIPVTTPKKAFKAFSGVLSGLVVEELHALYLDQRRRTLACRRLTRGNSTNTIVDPAQIYRTAVALNAKSVVIAHNHPSGDPTPSHADRVVTRRVQRAGVVLGIPLVDHLVIASNTFVSMSERGMM